MESITNSLQGINQGIHDLNQRFEQLGRDLNQRIDKLVLWGCSTILGAFVALSVQFWFKR